MAGRQISSPFTLRITQAEVLDSQLGPDDMGALARDADGGEGGGGGTLCPGTYCSGGYSAPPPPETLTEA